MAGKKAKKEGNGGKNKILNFSIAFKYPFNRLTGLLNILWFLFILVGWFALFGYIIRVTRNFLKGDFKGLPRFNFRENLKLGFFMFFKSLPLLLAAIAINIVLAMIPVLGLVGILAFSIFVLPMLTINFFLKGTVESSFDISKVHFVFRNIEDYLVVILKTIGLQLIFLLMILVLVGLPAGVFTKNIFLADFYRRRVK